MFFFFTLVCIDLTICIKILNYNTIEGLYGLIGLPIHISISSLYIYQSIFRIIYLSFHLENFLEVFSSYKLSIFSNFHIFTELSEYIFEKKISLPFIGDDKLCF